MRHRARSRDGRQWAVGSWHGSWQWGDTSTQRWGVGDLATGKREGMGMGTHRARGTGRVEHSRHEHSSTTVACGRRDLPAQLKNNHERPPRSGRSRTGLWHLSFLKRTQGLISRVTVRTATSMCLQPQNEQTNHEPVQSARTPVSTSRANKFQSIAEERMYSAAPQSPVCMSGVRAHGGTDLSYVCPPRNEAPAAGAVRGSRSVTNIL